jgi:hypothetical protein
MRATARFHADKAGQQIRKKYCHLIALELLLEHRLTPPIHAVDLKHILCQINTNCRNLHDDALLGSVVVQRFHFGTSDAVTGGGASIPLGKNALLHCTTAGFTPLRLDHESFAVYCLLGSAFYPVLVHRLAVSLHASSPRSVALTQLRFTSFAVVSSRRDLHPQECAHAGRTKKKPADLSVAGLNPIL